MLAGRPGVSDLYSASSRTTGRWAYGH